MRTADQPQRPESREPTTVAGDNLLTDIIQDHEGPSYHVIERIRWGILAIESEARAAERTETGDIVSRLREALLRFGEHRDGCIADSPLDDGDYPELCRCGFRAARALAADPQEPSDV